MKTLWPLVLLAEMFTFEGWAQGELGFSNHIRNLIDAPVFDTDCQTRLSGSAFLSEFYAGTTPDSLQAVGGVVPFSFGPAAGYVFEASGARIPDVTDGQAFF